MRAVFAAMALWLLAGCDLFNRKDTCNEFTTTTRSLSGNWVIRGHGNWSGCGTGSPYEGSFALGPSQPLAVAQTGASSLSGTLALQSPVEGFTLSGEVRGACVSFGTREQTSAGELRLEFDGEVSRPGLVTGKLSGNGPGTCTVSGDFNVDVTTSP